MTNNTQPAEQFQEFSPTLTAWCMNDRVIHKPGNNDGEQIYNNKKTNTMLMALLNAKLNVWPLNE